MEHPGRVQLQEGKNKYPQFDERHENTDYLHEQ